MKTRSVGSLKKSVSFCIMLVTSLIMGCSKDSISDKKVLQESEVTTSSEEQVDINNIEFEFNGFNPTDQLTWGEVVETDSDGNPTQYVKELSNGNVQTLFFDHGTKNDKFQQEENIPGAEFIHWNRASNLEPIVIHDETIGVWSFILQKYARVWSQSPMVNLVVLPSSNKPALNSPSLNSIQKCRRRNIGAITVCNYDFRINPAMLNTRGGYAWTENTPDGHIVAAVIHLNHAHYRLDEDHSDYEELTEGSISHATANRNFVVCHELGHALGLRHYSEDVEESKGTCMDYSNNPWPNLNPDSHDLAELLKNYGHTHGIIDGVICERKGARGTIFETHHREISFNGEKAIVGRVRPYREEDKAIRNPQRLVFQMNKENVSYQWNVIDADSDHTDNYSNNTDMKAENHPSIGSPKVHVSNVARSAEAMPLDVQGHFESLIRMGESGSVSDFSCKKASGNELFDIKEFTPPLPEENSGGYNLVPVKDANDKEQRNDRGTLYHYVPVLYKHSEYTKDEHKKPTIK